MDRFPLHDDEIIGDDEEEELDTSAPRYKPEYGVLRKERAKIVAVEHYKIAIDINNTGPHLKHLWLSPAYISGGFSSSLKKGSEGWAEYITSPNSGLWYFKPD